MTLEILQQKSQIKSARNQMKARQISFLGSKLDAIFYRLGLSSKLQLGDEIKSWDVLKTVEFIERKLGRDAAIVDFGCFCSEVLLCLHKLGFQQLTGCDLNPDVQKMPFAAEIDYRQEDFLDSRLKDASVDAITSISVLEHGFDGPAYLAEAARLLRPGGFLLSSFDYWPEKIDTGNTRFFDLSWTLFSRDEIEAFVSLAGDFGLQPVDELHYEASSRPVKCANFRYTFGWLALEKQR